MMKKTGLALMTFAFLAVLSIASFAADRTLAIVNGEAIFESEFNSVANPIIEQYRNTTPQASQNIADINQRKDAVLDRLVEFTLLKQDAKKNKVTATNQEIRDAVSQIRQQGFNNNEAAFNDALKRENLTRTKFEARIADQLTVNKYVNQSIERRTARPTEDQIRAFYDRVKIKAKGGQIGIIPGSQGTKSYIVKGLGNAESFKSCSHGAGRAMGRKEAIRTLNLEAEKERLDAQGILHSIRGKSDLEEAPSAYKNIETVMEAQKDLVEIQIELSPLAVVKG
jgi:RNA-splicing ligase RtcB